MLVTWNFTTSVRSGLMLLEKFYEIRDQLTEFDIERLKKLAQQAKESMK